MNTYLFTLRPGAQPTIEQGRATVEQAMALCDAVHWRPLWGRPCSASNGSKS